MLRSVMLLVDTDHKVDGDKNLIFFKDDVYYSTNESSYNDYIEEFPIIIVELDTGGCAYLQKDLNMKILDLNLDDMEFKSIKSKSLNELLTYLYDKIELKLVEAVGV